MNKVVEYTVSCASRFCLTFPENKRDKKITDVFLFRLVDSQTCMLLGHDRKQKAKQFPERDCRTRRSAQKKTSRVVGK